jgi:hypothetical protein
LPKRSIIEMSQQIEFHRVLLDGGDPSGADSIFVSHARATLGDAAAPSIRGDPSFR